MQLYDCMTDGAAVRLMRRINPDEVVAYGAAVMAAGLSSEQSVEYGGLIDVIPLSLGIQTAGGFMTTVLNRNAQMLFSTNKDGQDWKEMASIKVFQGERRMARNNHFLGSFQIKGIPAAPRGVPQIQVLFKVDENGLLTVEANSKDSGKRSELVIKQERFLSGEQIQESLSEAASFPSVVCRFLLASQAESFAKDDQREFDRAEARMALKALVRSLHSAAESASEEDAGIFLEAASEGQDWLAANPDAEAEEIHEKREEHRAAPDGRFLLLCKFRASTRISKGAFCKSPVGAMCAGAASSQEEKPTKTPKPGEALSSIAYLRAAEAQFHFRGALAAIGGVLLLAGCFWAAVRFLTSQSYLVPILAGIVCIAISAAADPQGLLRHLPEEDAKLSLRLRNRQACSQGTNACVQLLLSGVTGLTQLTMDCHGTIFEVYDHGFMLTELPRGWQPIVNSSGRLARVAKVALDPHGTAYFLSEEGELLMMVSAVRYLEHASSSDEELKLEFVDKTKLPADVRLDAWRNRPMESPRDLDLDENFSPSTFAPSPAEMATDDEDVQDFLLNRRIFDIIHDDSPVTNAIRKWGRVQLLAMQSGSSEGGVREIVQSMGPDFVNLVLCRSFLSFFPSLLQQLMLPVVIPLGADEGVSAGKSKSGLARPAAAWPQEDGRPGAPPISWILRFLQQRNEAKMQKITEPELLPLVVPNIFGVLTERSRTLAYSLLHKLKVCAAAAGAGCVVYAATLFRGFGRKALLEGLASGGLGTMVKDGEESRKKARLAAVLGLLSAGGAIVVGMSFERFNRRPKDPSSLQPSTDRPFEPEREASPPSSEVS
eukprot:s4102_g2.t1